MLINRRSNIYILLISILAFFSNAISVVSNPITPTKEISIQEVLRKLEIRQKEIKKEVLDITYMAKTVYREMDKDGNAKKEVLVDKKIYMKNDDRRHEEYISMIIDGKKLSDDELRKEAKEWQKNNTRGKDTKSPLDEKFRNDYNFALLGSSVFNRQPVWVIEFKSKKKEDNYIDGRAYIIKDKFDIAKVDFTPAKIPSVIKNIELSLIYSDIQGYWLPVKFQMAMKVDVKVVFSMYNKEIKVEDTYYQHRINTGFDDSIFSS